jgi:hypothetical protein
MLIYQRVDPHGQRGPGIYQNLSDVTEAGDLSVSQICGPFFTARKMKMAIGM